MNPPRNAIPKEPPCARAAVEHGAQPAPRAALVFLAHGSRDPLWSGFLDAVIERALAQNSEACIRKAFLESMAPSLLDEVDALTAQGVCRVVIVPLFLGSGRHVREDVPAVVAALRARHPSLEIDLRASAGEDPAVLELLARLGLEALGAR